MIADLVEVHIIGHQYMGPLIKAKPNISDLGNDYVKLPRDRTPILTRYTQKLILRPN